MTVLVASASRHGSTTEIAAAIGRVLRERGVDVQVENVENVDSLAPYDAVVLGSAVYVGHWLEPAQRFVELHADELAGKRTWLFSSGPVGDPPKPSPASAVDIEDVVSRTAPEEHRVFGGKIDRKELGLAERAIVRAVRAREGDYRDWRAIRSFGEEIAQRLD
jgi:menaquinone-dependent protoporphyrinogen oxidase